MKKKVALCFRGKTNYFINSVDNIKSYIIDDLHHFASKICNR